MGEVVAPQMVDQAGGQLAVVQPPVVVFGGAHPRGQVHLVDVHRPVAQVLIAPRLHPAGIAPSVLVDIPHHRGAGGADLREEGVRIGLDSQVPLAGADLVLVLVAFLEARHEGVPDAGAAEPPHRMPAAVPLVEGADHAHAFGVGRPHGEDHARHAVDGERVRAHLFPKAVVPPFPGEVEIQLAEEGGIVGGGWLALGVHQDLHVHRRVRRSRRRRGIGDHGCSGRSVRGRGRRHNPPRSAQGTGDRLGGQLLRRGEARGIRRGRFRSGRSGDDGPWGC